MLAEPDRLISVGPVDAALFSEWIAQAVVVAVRRRFGRSNDPGEIAGYVTELVRRERPNDEARLVPAGVALLRSTLDGGDVRQAAPGLLRAELAPLVLRDLLPGLDVDELVVAVTGRMARLRRRRRWPPRRHRPTVVEGPQTAIGRLLKAQTRYDHEALDRLPAEPSDELAFHVTWEVFAELVRLRFAAGEPPAEVIEGLVTRVEATSRSTPVHADTVRQVIRLELVGADVMGRPADDEESAMRRMVARLFTFVQLVEDLALYEREVDEVILAAERRMTGA